MPPKTPAQKRAQEKWIEKNKEYYAEKQRIFTLNYYYNNREELLAKKKIYYQLKKNQLNQLDDLDDTVEDVITTDI
jgi:hypothetical protein